MRQRSAWYDFGAMVPITKNCGCTKRMDYTSKESASSVQHAAWTLMLVIKGLDAACWIRLPRVDMQPSKPNLRVADD